MAVIDWHSRKVLSWQLPSTMDGSFYIDALNEAIDNYGRPEIFNANQGSQFTSDDLTQILKRHEIAISMDDRAR